MLGERSGSAVMGLAFPSAAVVKSAAVLDRRERMIVRLAVVDVREAIESAGEAAGDTSEVRLAFHALFPHCPER